jgi:nucleotidyltransferase/DNA polymerase involved in DNA repair
MSIRRCLQQIREIFAEYTSMIEPLSLDEAYLDVTENLKDMERSRWRSAPRSSRSPAQCLGRHFLQ